MEWHDKNHKRSETEATNIRIATRRPIVYIYTQKEIISIVLVEKLGRLNELRMLSSDTFEISENSKPTYGKLLEVITQLNGKFNILKLLSFI